MKIAIIGSKGIPASFGGVERHVEELAIGLVNKGHDVTVYSRKWYTNYQDNKYRGVKIRNIKSIKTKNLDTISYVFLATIDAMKNNDFDIIHYQGVGPALLSFIPRILKRNVKIVATFHCEDYKHEKWSLFAKMMLKFGENAAAIFPHKTITVSKILKDKVRNKYNREAEYIPNGVEMKDLEKIQKNYDVYDKFNIYPNKYILSVTRLIRHKGVHDTIEAYKKLPKDLKEQYKLVLVGGSLFGDNYEKELKKLIGNDENIVMTGMQTGIDLETLFTGAKLFIHSSYTEGLPISLLEALNYNIPVLVSDISEHLEVVGTDKGFSFKLGKVDDLRLKIETLLSHENAALLDETAVRARRYVQREYNWENIIVKTEELYADALDGKRNKHTAHGVARI